VFCAQSRIEDEDGLGMPLTLGGNFDTRHDMPPIALKGTHLERK
jgi:hypothetical protein